MEKFQKNIHVNEVKVPLYSKKTKSKYIFLISRVLPACGMWHYKLGDKHKRIVVVAGNSDNDASVEYLYLDHHNQYRKGWVIGPGLPGPNSNHRIFQFHNSILMMTYSSVNSLSGMNASITVLDSPTGTWKLKAPARVGVFFAASLMIPDHLVDCE